MIVCSHVILFQPPPFLLPAVDAYLRERNSFNNIYHLVVQCCECLSLWKLLCEHQFHLTANGLSLVSTRTMYRVLLSSQMENVVLSREHQRRLARYCFYMCG